MLITRRICRVKVFICEILKKKMIKSTPKKRRVIEFFTTFF